MPAVASKYLGIYLNDHLAGSTAGLELVKRAVGAYEGTELGAFLSDLRLEIEEDRRTLEGIMAQFDIGADHAKQALAWAGEKAGRLKLNGELRGTSPLSPLVELEALSLGIEGKRLMWIALEQAGPVAEQIGVDRLAELRARAKRQRKAVEEHRRVIARSALA